MKKMMKKFLTAFCALSLFMTMPGVTVLAQNLQDDMVISVAEDPEEIIDELCINEDTEDLAEGSELTDELGLVDIPSYTELSEEMIAKVEEDFSRVEELVGTQYTDSDPGFEVYNANTRIYGLEGSGNSVYDIMMNTEMIYQQLAEYAMEEKALYYTSGMWIGFFDEVFKTCPMYGYETILMDYLAFDAESAETKNSLDDAILDFSVNLTKAGMKLTEVNVDTYNKFVNDLSKEQAIQLGKGVIDKTTLRLAEDSFDLALLSGNTAKDVIDNLAEITAASKKRQKQVAFLNMVKENLGEDDYWLRFAFEDIIGTYGNANLPVMMMQGGRKTAYECGRALVGMGWDALTDAAGENVAVPIVLVKTGASGLNVLFGTKTLSNDLMAILTVYILDSELREALRKSKWEFLNNPTTETAIRFNGAFDSYLEYQLYASQVAKQYLYDIINGGLLTKTYAQICHTENIETADELIKLCDSQINIRKRIASFEHQYYQIYYGKYDKNMFVVAINGQNEPQEIPVTGISFSRKTRTIQMDNTWVEMDDVVIKPSNATNQGFKITSSDESILTVNSLFRWMTPVKPGTVTITVTSDDGGFTATQKVIVADAENETGWEEEYPYKVGENVWAKIVEEDNGETLYFYSKNGTLYKDWKNRIDSSPFSDNRLTTITKIILSKGSGKLYLPEDSSELFSGDNYGRLKSIKSIELNKVDTSRVIYMNSMFNGCSELETVDVSSFDTSNVTKMNSMFGNCRTLTSLDVSNFDTSKVTTMAGMFVNCPSLKELDLSSFNTSNVTDMGYMFSDDIFLSTLDLSGFNTSKVKNMKGMFNTCVKLANLKLSDFDTSNVNNMEDMFSQCSSLTYLDLSDFDASKVTVMSGMFYGCSSLTKLDLNNFKTSYVTNMHQMFKGCKSLINLDLSSFNTSKVTDMSHIFYGCSSLIKLDLSVFDTSIVKDMDWMFNGCSSLTSLDLSSFNTSNVTSMYGMFTNCSSLTTLDLSSFDMSDVGQATSMFTGCSSLQLLETPKKKNQLPVINLPITMFDKFGNPYTKLDDLTESITLTREKLVSTVDITDCMITLSSINYSYDGKSKEPVVFVGYDDNTLVDGTDYTVDYFNNTNAGTATVKVTGKGKYAGTITKTFTIAKATPTLKFASSSLSKKIGDAAFTNTLTKTTDGIVTFKSSNTGVATVNSTSGLVMIKGAGKVIITATASAGTNYKGGSASYTLTATAPSPAGFSDVQDPSHPYYKAIYWAAEAGITKGYSDGTFGIDRSCTRGEMMMFLWRYAGKQEPKTVSKSPFKDVPKTHTFYKAILWGSQKGITKGYSDGSFGVNRNVTRGECMMFLWRLKGKPAPKAVAKAPFPDVPKSHVFYNAVLWGYQKRITTGFTSGKLKGKFGVNENCSRGQIVTFLYRAK